MPLWHIYTPPGAYTNEDKKALAEAITKNNVEFAQIPAFFVNVYFFEVPVDDTYIGGEAKSGFIRIVTDIIARHLPTPEEQEACMASIEETIQPFTVGRGFDTEIHLDETPIGLWRVNGIKAPVAHPEIFAQWVEENRPVPWEAPVSA
ncbi:tautomerase family protein [Streptomyces sp. NBC_00631]|uniref:tautomerase family protein n=1 Tax=Streptomyces sp. NBC_00631 TaxID=2975793 RepID=UPI0030E0A429